MNDKINIEEASNNIIDFDYSMSIECPECRYQIDLIKQDTDNCFSECIFNNRWDDVKGVEVYCNACEHEFKCDGVEY